MNTFGMRRPDDGRDDVVTNRYRCRGCGKRWDNEWDHALEDSCPACGRVGQPHNRAWLTPRGQITAHWVTMLVVGWSLGLWCGFFLWGT